MKRDENGKLMGLEYREDKDKIVIIPVSIQEELLNKPDFPVKVVDTACQPKMQERVDGGRKEVKEAIKKADEWEKELKGK